MPSQYPQSVLPDAFGTLWICPLIFIVVKFWTSVQTVIQGRTIRLCWSIIYYAQFGCSLIISYYCMMWQITNWVGNGRRVSYRFNYVLTQLFFDYWVIAAIKLLGSASVALILHLINLLSAVIVQGRMWPSPEERKFKQGRFTLFHSETHHTQMVYHQLLKIINILSWLSSVHFICCWLATTFKEWVLRLTDEVLVGESWTEPDNTQPKLVWTAVGPLGPQIISPVTSFQYWSKPKRISTLSSLSPCD